MRRATTVCHPERSETKSKDPAKSADGSATGFLDFARNDSIRIERLAVFPYRVSQWLLPDS